MAASMNQNQPNPYADIFFDHIHSGLEDSLAQIKATEHVLSDHERVQAWNMLDYGLQCPQAWSITRELLFELAPKMEQAGFRDDWIGYLERAITLGRDYQDLQVEAAMCLNLGYLYQLQAKYGQAQKWLLLSQSRFTKIDDTQGVGTVLNRLAYIARGRQEYTKAEELCYRAMKLLHKDDIELCHSYNILAELACDIRDWLNAEKYLGKSLEIATKHKDSRHIAWAYLNVGPVLRRQGKVEDAKKAYQHAETLFSGIQEPLSMAITQMNTGMILFLECQSS